jgi:hypothetical protein
MGYNWVKLATSVWPSPTKDFLWLRHWLVPCTHGVPYGMVACGRCARNCLAGMACGCMDDLVATCNKVSGQVNKVSLATLWWCCPIRTTGDLGHGRPVRRTCVAWRGMARQGRTPVQTKRVCHTDGIGVVQILETFMLQNISLGWSHPIPRISPRSYLHNLNDSVRGEDFPVKTASLTGGSPMTRTCVVVACGESSSSPILCINTHVINE